MPLAYIKFVNRGPSEVDPDYGVDADGPGIDNSLPPGTPPIAGNLPSPPPGVWPPPSFSRPIVPTHPIATPRPPHVSGQPIPGGGAPRPDQGLPGGGHVDNSLPVQPGTIWPPANGAPSGTFWVVAGIPGVGWRYVCVDPSLGADNTLPSHPARPDQGLPDAPAPKK